MPETLRNGRKTSFESRKTAHIAALVLSIIVMALSFGVARAEVSGAPPPVVRSVAIGGDATATTITLDLSRSVAASVFALADPYRLVVDLPAVRFELPKSAGAAGSGISGDGRSLIGPWRWGAFAAGRARIVFDLREPVRIGAVDMVPGDDTRPTRMIVALAGGKRADIVDMRPIRVGPVDPPASPPPPTVEPVATSGAAVKEDRKPIATAAVAPPLRHLVVIDPGHGGVDAGTVSPATGTPEKTVVLEMARVLARRLEATGRYTVRLTRDSDVFIPLGQRVSIARAAHAELFVSIHADAEYDHSVRGATVYTLAETASDARAAALAAKENRSDSIAGLIDEDAKDEVGDILSDLMRRETRRFSHELARDVLDEYRRNGRLVKGAAHREAGLKVLRAHDFPSILVEIGFLSNKLDEAQMVSPEWREQTAHSLVGAIDRWFSAHGNGATATGDVPAVGGGAAASP